MLGACGASLVRKDRKGTSIYHVPVTAVSFYRGVFVQCRVGHKQLLVLHGAQYVRSIYVVLVW